MVRASLIAALSLHASASAKVVPASDEAFRFIGRFDQSDAGVRFDRNGFEIQFRVEGVSDVILQLSQRLTESYGVSANPTGSAPHDFLVYVDEQPQIMPIEGSKCTYCTFDTSLIANETVTDYAILSGLSTGSHEIRIMKTTEAEFNDREPSPNWLTFHSLTVNGGDVVEPSSPRQSRRIEFIGDSITAGYCNLCKGPGPFAEGLEGRVAGGETQETFALSWPTLTCSALGAECSTIAWSGMGLVRNCCGGDVYMPEVWSRTVATDKDSKYDFQSWAPDALVVNLGTNDGGQSITPEFVEAYKSLVLKAHMEYGSDLHVFLACGPMHSNYCSSVHEVIDNVTARGVRAFFLDQTPFLNGTFGPACCGHPGVQVDEAMAKAAVEFIGKTMAWNDFAVLV